MFAYRITQLETGIVVGTSEEPILVCATLEIARRAVADAELLATLPPRRLLAHEVSVPQPQDDGEGEADFDGVAVAQGGR